MIAKKSTSLAEKEAWTDGSNAARHGAARHHAGRNLPPTKQTLVGTFRITAATIAQGQPLRSIIVRQLGRAVQRVVDAGASICAVTSMAMRAEIVAEAGCYGSPYAASRISHL